MLDRLLKILSANTDEETLEREDAARIAVAALLVEAARADDVYLEAERDMIDRILAERYALSAEQVRDLRSAGEKAQAEASDLVRFTRAVKESIPFEDRIEVIEAVWRVIYADDERDPDEGALIRRLAGLLYVPDRDAGLARQRVTGQEP